MWPWLEKIASACWDRVRRYTLTRRDEEDGGGSGSGSGADAVDDDLLWSRDLARHAAGEFSFAVVQANEVLEDHSQVETGAAATFVGVYDGHGGAEASRFISNHLSAHLVRTYPHLYISNAQSFTRFSHVQCCSLAYNLVNLLFQVKQWLIFYAWS